MTVDNNVMYANKLKELYGIEVNRYISQNRDGTYTTYDKQRYKHAQTLSKKHFIRHLEGTQTLGVFASGLFTSFICFDVDTGKHNIETAERDTRYLVGILNYDFGISLDDIHISYSGNKGYHIEIFFDKSIPVAKAKQFYKLVLDKSGFKPSDIEFRPTGTQGVKIPLGWHKVTSHFCPYVDHNLSVLDNSYLMTIKPLNTEQFFNGLALDDDDILILEHEKAHEFDTLHSEINLIQDDLNNILPECERVLSENHLVTPHTRHKMTLIGAMFLRSQGHTQDDVIKIVNDVMLNTKRTSQGYINASESEIISEVKRITGLVFKHDYKLRQAQRDVYVYQHEIDVILNVKGWHNKKLLFSMLIHSKRHATKDGIFSMTYEQLHDYGNTTDRNKLKSHISKLNEYIEVVSSNVMDIDRCKREGKIYKKPNRYRLKESIKKSFDNHSAKVEIKANASLEQVIQCFYNLDDLKKHLTRTEISKLKVANL